MRRQLLTWLLPSALAVLVAFSACAYWIARGALLTEAGRSVSALTVAAAGRVEAFFSQRESDILAAAESPLLRDHYLNARFGLKEEAQEALRGVRDMLTRLSKRTGVYPSLLYLGADDKELCRVGSGPPPSKRLLERLRLSAKGEVLIEEEGDGVVHYAVAVRDESGARRGALVLDCSLASIDSFLASLKLGASGRARLVPRRESVRDPDLLGAMIRDAAPVGGTPWAVEIEAERGEFLAGLDYLRAATLVFLFLAALVLSLGISRQTAVLLRPLARLEAAARGFAEGSFAAPLEREGPREVQTVAVAFNTMAEHLSERTKDLQARVRELSALQELSEWALLQSGKSEVAEACLEAAVAGLGFARGALYLIDEDKREIVGECVYGTESSELSRAVMKKRRVSVDAHDILAHVYRTRRPVSVEDPSKDPRCDPKFVAEANTKGFAMAPVLAGEKVLAIIGVDYGSEARRLDEASFMSLSMFCAAAGVVLDHARLLSELRASEARYRASVEYSPAAVVDLDGDKKITLWNRAARDLFGFSEKEAVGRTLGLVGLEARVGRFEAKARNKDGRTLDVSVSCTSSGKEWFVVIEDETHEKELREQLVHAEKLSAAGTLLGAVAHELNSPLQAVTANAELSLESSGEEHKNDLKEVVRHAMRCRDIVSGLLRFVRQETTTRARVPLNAVVEETVLLMNYRIEKKEFCRLVLALDRGAPAAAGDFKQLQQVLVNLLMNACDALSGRPDPREIRVGTDREGGGVRLWVEDTGPGVPKDLCKKIFEPFYTTKAAGFGTGLGLAISSQIIKDMGGTLMCEDAPVGGARFVASLPACPAGLTEPRRPSLDMPEACPGKRVLLVDDDPGVVNAMERLAREDGLLTAVASGVDMAREKILKESFDLVVSDVEMDGRRGLELLALRKEGRPAFVFVTGDTLNTALRREVEGHKAPLLSKPFMRVDFLREVRKGLG